jgi:hypothetical protein
LFGAAGGALFAILVFVGIAIAPGPSSAKGSTVAEYFATHKTVTLWQAVLAGFGFVLFIWFAATFAGRFASGPAVIATAAVTAALYLVAIGAWESLGETYGGIDITAAPTETYGDAHVLYDVGVGATHLVNFAVAAFIGATTAGLLVAGRRTFGRIGIVLTAIELVNAPFQIAATSHWSDVVGGVVFVAFLAWVFATSGALVVMTRRGAINKA